VQALQQRPEAVRRELDKSHAASGTAAPAGASRAQRRRATSEDADAGHE